MERAEFERDVDGAGGLFGLEKACQLCFPPPNGLNSQDSINKVTYCPNKKARVVQFGQHFLVLTYFKISFKHCYECVIW